MGDQRRTDIHRFGVGQRHRLAAAGGHEDIHRSIVMLHFAVPHTAREDRPVAERFGGTRLQRLSSPAVPHDQQPYVRSPPGQQRSRIHQTLHVLYRREAPEEAEHDLIARDPEPAPGPGAIRPVKLGKVHRVMHDLNRRSDALVDQPLSHPLNRRGHHITEVEEAPHVAADNALHPLLRQEGSIGVQLILGVCGGDEGVTTPASPAMTPCAHPRGVLAVDDVNLERQQLQLLRRVLEHRQGEHVVHLARQQHGAIAVDIRVVRKRILCGGGGGEDMHLMPALEQAAAVEVRDVRDPVEAGWIGVGEKRDAHRSPKLPSDAVRFVSISQHLPPRQQRNSVSPPPGRRREARRYSSGHREAPPLPRGLWCDGSRPTAGLASFRPLCG